MPFATLQPLSFHGDLLIKNPFKNENFQTTKQNTAKAEWELKKGMEVGSVGSHSDFASC